MKINDFIDFSKFPIFLVLKSLATTLLAVRGRFHAGNMLFRGHTNDPSEQNSQFSPKTNSEVSRHSLPLADMSRMIEIYENQ